MRHYPVVVVLLTWTELLSPIVGDPRCSKVVLHAWCSSESTSRLIEALSSCNYDRYVPLYERRCRLNEQGHFCGSFMDYSSDILAASQECLDQEELGECSESCREQLELLRKDLGCCINEMLNRTDFLYDPVFNNTLWEECGVETAAPSCQPSSLARFLQTKKENCTSDELYNRANHATCKRSILQPLLELYESYGCAGIGEDQLNACGVDEHEQWCVGRFYARRWTIRKLAQSADIHCPRTDECSEDCRTSIQALGEVFGCCVNNVLNNTFVELVFSETFEFYKNYTSDELWGTCRLPRPAHCKVMLYSAGGASGSRHQLPFYTIVAMLAVVTIITQAF